jgi:hypothetical protein
MIISRHDFHSFDTFTSKLPSEYLPDKTPAKVLPLEAIGHIFMEYLQNFPNFTFGVKPLGRYNTSSAYSISEGDTFSIQMREKVATLVHLCA